MIFPSAKQSAFLTIAAVLLGHFFISLGRSETIIELLAQQWYYIDLFFVSIIVFLIVFYISIVHYSLDVRIPLRENFTKRILIQSLPGLVAPVLLSFFLTFIYMEFILGQKITESTFLVYELPIAVVVIITINLVFVILSLLKSKEATEEQPAIRETILVTQGDRTLPLQVNDIAGITKEGDYTMICNFDQQKFVSNETLEELMNSLPGKIFFRANRQWIVHRNVCGAYITERSGKIGLKLKSPFTEEIPVSQKRAQEFKAWLAGN